MWGGGCKYPNSRQTKPPSTHTGPTWSGAILFNFGWLFGWLFGWRFFCLKTDTRTLATTILCSHPNYCVLLHEPSMQWPAQTDSATSLLTASEVWSPVASVSLVMFVCLSQETGLRQGRCAGGGGGVRPQVFKKKLHAKM